MRDEARHLYPALLRQVLRQGCCLRHDGDMVALFTTCCRTGLTFFLAFCTSTRPLLDDLESHYCFSAFLIHSLLEICRSLAAHLPFPPTTTTPTTPPFPHLPPYQKTCCCCHCACHVLLLPQACCCFCSMPPFPMPSPSPKIGSSLRGSLGTCLALPLPRKHLSGAALQGFCKFGHLHAVPCLQETGAALLLFPLT